HCARSGRMIVESDQFPAAEAIFYLHDFKLADVRPSIAEAAKQAAHSETVVAECQSGGTREQRDYADDGANSKESYRHPANFCHDFWRVARQSQRYKEGAETADPRDAAECQGRTNEH